MDPWERPLYKCLIIINIREMLAKYERVGGNTCEKEREKGWPVALRKLDEVRHAICSKFPPLTDEDCH